MLHNWKLENKNISAEIHLPLFCRQKPEWNTKTALKLLAKKIYHKTNNHPWINLSLNPDGSCSPRPLFLLSTCSAASQGRKQPSKVMGRYVTFWSSHTTCLKQAHMFKWNINNQNILQVQSHQPKNWNPFIIMNKSVFYTCDPKWRSCKTSTSCFNPIWKGCSAYSRLSRPSTQRQPLLFLNNCFSNQNSIFLLQNTMKLE